LMEGVQGVRRRGPAAAAAILRAVLLASMLGATLVAATPAQAHRLDLMTPNKAGPILRGETTMGQMRDWFGPPTARKVVPVGCVKVIRAHWGNDLKVYASRGDTRTVEAIFVRDRTIDSAVHGELTMHTRRGLRVGNGEGRLRKLYPGSEPITHAGHTHYRLGTSPDGPYLMAKVVKKEVVQLEAWPLEFC
jgi:hypothetical protein